MKPSFSTNTAVDSSGPNTTAPTINLFQGVVNKQSSPTQIYIIPLGGAITVLLWMLDGKANRWFSVGVATACAVDALTYIAAIPPADIEELYLQITANAGSACTKFGYGFQGSR